MAKKANRTVFVCSECGEEYVQWQGKCAVCGNWNTLKEFTIPNDSAPSRQGISSDEGQGAQPLPSVKTDLVKRLTTGFSEFDRVLGGGIVPGAVMLLGGDPGIGKSTLLLQLAEKLQQSVLYVSGEESAEQIKLRAERLGVKSEKVQVLAATDSNHVQREIEKHKPSLVVIDSIQTMYDPAFPSTPGSIVQVREGAIRFQQLAKRLHVPLVLVGHITKEGTVAGPRTLEHLVDVVLYLEGEPEHDLRVLRAVKNRFGDATETGLFTMVEQGLEEVTNPSTLLLQERVEAPGSVLTMVMEGSRPVLVEVQALTVPTVFGNPRRTASGFDLNRLNLLLAVLQRRAHVDLSNHDVYINIVGGLRLKDPAIDAAVCVALASARGEKTVDQNLVVMGELGLAGEIRKVSKQDRREKEAQQLGYKVPPPAKQLQDLIRTAVPRSQAH
jgi:DNA repair protein RadA/Sms